MKPCDIIKLVLSFTVCFITAFIGSAFTTGGISEWYLVINKPDFTPPNWIFGPVWTALYFLMAISLYLIWKNQKTDNRAALSFFLINLILNALWSVLFFGMNELIIAFIEICVLWLFILLTIVFSFRVSKVASTLLIPYLIWVTFAGFLNINIAILN